MTGGAPESRPAFWLDHYGTGSPPTGTAGAAVTAVLREGNSEVEALLIERSVRPDDPASGHVALPGGRVAVEDDSLAATARRELEEEVGLSRGDLAGELRYVAIEHAPRFGLSVGFFAGELGPEAHPPSVRSPMEVAHVFWLPRGALATTRTVERETPRGRLPVPATVYEGHILWGFTRRVLRSFFRYPAEDAAVGPLFGARTHDGGAKTAPDSPE